MNRSPEKKLIDWSVLPALVARLKAEGRRIVTTNGCFDLLHWGHAKYLHQARQEGDLLICGINSDRSVRSLGKGDNRPLQPEKFRALQVAALESVDYVVIFDESTPDRFLDVVRPQVHIKGADYASKPIPERALVEKHGGLIELIPFVEGFSTTSLIEKIRR